MDLLNDVGIVHSSGRYLALDKQSGALKNEGWNMSLEHELREVAHLATKEDVYALVDGLRVLIFEEGR